MKINMRVGTTRTRVVAHLMPSVAASIAVYAGSEGISISRAMVRIVAEWCVRRPQEKAPRKRGEGPKETGRRIAKAVQGRVGAS